MATTPATTTGRKKTPPAEPRQAALADAEGVETGGDLLDLGDELGDGQRPTGIVDEQRMIGRRLVACGEQPPERGGVENR